MVKSPSYIRALLDCHALPKPEVNENLLADLQRDGLIYPVMNSWSTTERGARYATMLMSVPLPEHRWIDPREERLK